MKALKWISVILVIVGGLNWGLVGIFGFNLVGTIFGTVPMLERIVYGLVGFATAYLITMVPKLLKE
jgi:uncharacterized membrane protein YuzA (DUF378 family)